MLARRLLFGLNNCFGITTSEQRFTFVESSTEPIYDKLDDAVKWTGPRILLYHVVSLGKLSCETIGFNHPRSYRKELFNLTCLAVDCKLAYITDKDRLTSHV